VSITPKIIPEVMCPCGRTMMPWSTWLCRICYLEKEIGYALSELERGGNAPGYDPPKTWHELGLSRLRKLIGVT
jgi:hypothetical protein